MRSPGPAIAALLLIGLPGDRVRAEQDPCDVIVIGHVIPGDRPEDARIVIAPVPAPPECRERRPSKLRAEQLPLAVRPEMLAYHIDSIAGQSVEVPYARVVGVLAPSVILVDSQRELPPLTGNRARVLVFTRGTTLRVSPALLVGATVTISGVARTLLGMQVSADGSWPAGLTPDVVKHLEIKAAILAKSVKTPDGVELTTSIVNP
ncbi:MAG: hypothetical protein DMF84_09520 [Acidobacteria bacterium]|nr:MAG: hypothetical protein DMF84_09520 [Acidobacteriota bacterium]